MRFDTWLLVSVLWHLFWFSAVGVAVAPAKKESNFTTVSFLGSILDERRLNPVSEQKQGVILEPVNLVKYAASPPVTFPERRSPESSLDASKSGVVSLTPFGSVKEGPPEESPMEEMKGVKAPELEIEGPAKERVVLYKPPLPPYPKWAEMAGLDFDLVLKFMVNQKGEVKLVETLISSGYPQVDTLGLRYLKNWRFNPLSSEDDKAGQWGKIKIKFRLESKD